MTEEEVMISPEWLESKGFILYRIGVELDQLWEFTADINVYDRIYIDKEFDRNRFVVVLQGEEPNGEFYCTGFEIYVLHNVGCGFTLIPNKFSEMPVKYFCMLYEGIRREKL
jgi:hypothetical protein